MTSYGVSIKLHYVRKIRIRHTDNYAFGLNTAGWKKRIHVAYMKSLESRLCCCCNNYVFDLGITRHYCRELLEGFPSRVA